MANGKADHDPGITLVILILVLYLAGWGIWTLFEVQFLEFIRHMRIAEFTVLSAITGDDDLKRLLAWLKAVRGVKEVQGYNVVGFTDTAASSVRDVAISYVRWPFGLILAAFGIHFAFFSRRTQFKRVYDLEGLIRVQAKVWSVIAPIVNFNPSKQSTRILGSAVPRKLPLFAEALAPEEWIAYHRIPVVNGLPDREATRNAFLLQLGSQWKGAETLPWHIKALFAAFALKGVQKRQDSDNLLGDLSLCWTSQRGFILAAPLKNRIEKIIRDPEIGGKAEEVAASHAYRTTALLAVLKWARSMGGVLAPAQFLWLRGEDRTLWYPLNNLGRRSFHTEGAGALAHYMAEVNAKKPLPIPRIDTAIVTLNQYMANNQVEIPPLEAGKPQKGRATKKKIPQAEPK